MYITSSANSMTLSWKQSGNVDNYIIKFNGSESTSVNFTGVGDVSVSVTVSELPTSGMHYCISVTAVSGHLSSDDAVHCNYTGNNQLMVVQVDCCVGYSDAIVSFLNVKICL